MIELIMMKKIMMEVKQIQVTSTSIKINFI